MYWFDGAPGGQEWTPAGAGVSKLFNLSPSLKVLEGPPGLPVRNSYAGLEEEEDEEEEGQEVPKITYEDYPEMGSKGQGPAPTPRYIRMPRKGQADRKVLSKAYNLAMKEKKEMEKRCSCAGCDGELQL